MALPGNAPAPASGDVHPDEQAFFDSAETRSAQRVDAVVLWLGVLLSTVAIPLGSGQQLPLVLPVWLCFVVFRPRGTWVAVSGWRLTCVLALVGAMLLSLNPFWNPLRGSWTSVALLSMLFTASSAARCAKSADLHALLRSFQRLGVVVSTLCIVQLVVQLSGGPFVSLTGVIPGQYFVQGFFYERPLSFGSDIYKPNGVFLLEPSIASQVIGLSLLLALRRFDASAWRTITVLVAGLAATLSGSGWIIVVIGLLPLIWRNRATRRNLAILATLGVVAVIAFPPSYAFLTSRAREVGEQNQSGNARFIQPYSQAVGVMTADAQRVLVGVGPGAASEFARSSLEQDTDVLFSPLPKAAVEYGLPLGVAIAVAAWSALRGPRHHPLTRVAPFATFFLLNGSLVFPFVWLMLWVVFGQWRAVDGGERV